jgi:GntR family transcriptional regulator
VIWVSDHGLINQDSAKPIYMQVADIITSRIQSGELARGAKLPAERDIAVQFGVAYDTVRRATAVLRERGLIVTVVGRGTYVAE